jgi:quinol monooxygenase YgiN
LVILTISVKARSSKRKQLLSTFELITDKTRQAKGCFGCRLFKDIDDENLITDRESREAIHHYVNTKEDKYEIHIC